MTSLGAWATSRAPHVFSFFKQIDLGRYELFLDLGSGDGLVACIAGLFTHAVGIEVDPGLCNVAQRAARDLRLTERVGFICGDYLNLPIRHADCLYHYPDKPMDRLEDLLKGWRGTLLVYGPHFPPQTMVSRSRKTGMRQEKAWFLLRSEPYANEALIRKSEGKTVCEANAYLLKDGQEVLVLEAVDVLENEGDQVRIANIFGEQKVIRGRIRSMSLVNHRILLEE